METQAAPTTSQIIGTQAAPTVDPRPASRQSHKDVKLTREEELEKKTIKILTETRDAVKQSTTSTEPEIAANGEAVKASHPPQGPSPSMKQADPSPVD